MANVNYTEAPELRTTCERLRERYWLYLGYVDLDAIYFAEMSEETEKPKKKPHVGVLSGLSTSWVKQLLQKNVKIDKRYCLAVWVNEWAQLTPVQQEWLLFDLLYAVGPLNDGKVRKRDVQEFGFICEYLGPYWRSGNQNLPSLLGSADPLPIPPPPLDDGDDDSTI